MKKLKYLTILLLLLISCPACKDDVDYEGERDAYGKPLPSAVQEARDYFESYVTEVDLSEEMTGLYPGNFAPDWSKAVVAVDGSHVCVNVPIVSNVYYEGSYAITYDSAGVWKEGAPYTAFGQKLLVVKEPDREYGCYLITIIPDKDNVTRSSSIAANMYNNGDRNTKFSGTTLFTALGNGNYPVAAERYLNGECYDVTSLWLSPDLRQFGEKLNALLGLKELYAQMKTVSKVGKYYNYNGQEVYVPLERVPTPPQEPPKPPTPSKPMTLEQQINYELWVAGLGSGQPGGAPAGGISGGGGGGGGGTGAGAGAGGGDAAAAAAAAMQQGQQQAGWVAYQQAMDRIKAQQSKPKTQTTQTQTTQTPPNVTVYDRTNGNTDFSSLLSDVRQIMPELSRNLFLLGIDLSKYTVIVSDEFCGASAKSRSSGELEICGRFLKNHTIIDQTAILWHEIYHIEKDQPTNLIDKELTDPIVITGVPINISNYINNVILDGILPEHKASLYNEYLTINFIRNPQFYRNEIAAYEAEIAQFPDSLVSAEYAADREYVLWEHRKRLEIAIQYYYN